VIGSESLKVASERTKCEAVIELELHWRLQEDRDVKNEEHLLRKAIRSKNNQPKSCYVAYS
jgi:hypothetical protein